jgi:microcystin-dependent protein
MMARLAEYRDDISGSLTTGGTSTAYTLTTNQGLATPTPTTGQLIAFVPNLTNGNATTLAADGGSAYPIQTGAGSAVGAGVLVQGTPYTTMFNGTAWVLRDFFGSPFIVPIGAMLPYTGTTSPNSSFVLPFGQAISRTAFAAYFALAGTTFGAGDGTTTFNVPDMRGRVSAFLDNIGGSAAGRIGTALVTDGGTINGQSMGSFGGSQNHAQTTAEMPTHNHSVTDPGHTHTASSNLQGIGSSGGYNGGNAGSISNSAQTITVNSNTTGVSINNNGSGNTMAWLQPTIMVNCILRVI